MTLNNQIFEVGGCIRDEFLGIHSKDIDFTYVVNDKSLTVEQGFQNMKNHLLDKGFKIFLETPDCFTIRAKFPSGHSNQGLVADFVMARKEIGYIPGTRKPLLEVGSLRDDLIRRDFTLNALAKDLNGNIIDLFDGIKHLKMGLLVTPLDPAKTFIDDPLRMIRALRFSITKNFTISPKVWKAMFIPGLINKLSEVVSQERIREELNKMFKHDTVKSLRLLNEIDKIEPKLMKVLFKDGMWLMPTMKS